MPVRDETEGRPGAPAGAAPGVAGWHADPWSSTRLRWWTGSAWTFSTTDSLADRSASSLPPPSVPVPVPSASAPPAPPPAKRPPAPPRRPFRTRRVVVAVVLGLLVGLVAARMLRHPARPTTSAGGSTAAPAPLTPGSLLPSAPSSPSTNTDPSAPALASLVVRPPDVADPLTVRVLPGGGGLSQATLDLCNGTFPSESSRTARLQDVVVDDQGEQVLSTEAVLYADQAGTAQAFAELEAGAGTCPPSPMPSPVREPTVATRFNPPPDGDWPQTPTVNRIAFDFTSTDASGQTTHSIAVYLRRGRALMGVYFSQPDGPQAAVAGQASIPGIVGVFAGRMAALPASVVGS